LRSRGAGEPKCVVGEEFGHVVRRRLLVFPVGAQSLIGRFFDDFTFPSDA
jgi:hypothetical protein